jgi:hypothetical protein
MIRRLRAFGVFWYDFIVGDDWRVAVGVILAFALTYRFGSATDTSLWWIVPAAVVVLLPVSIHRVTRRPRS